MVVGQAVEAEVVGQPVQPDGDLGGPPEVLVLDAVVDLEHRARELHPVGDLTVGHAGDSYPQVVELDHLHVPAEVRRDQRQVGGHVEHAWIQVAHQAVPTGTQRATDAGRLDPPLDPGPRPLVLHVPRDRPERDPEAQERVRHLRQRARAAVGQPLPGVEGPVVHHLGRLQVDDQHGGTAALRHRRQHRRRHVRREVAHDQVAARDPQRLGSTSTVFGVGDEADIDHVAVERAHPLAHPPGRLLQLRQQAGELRPVGAEPAGNEPDLGAPRIDPPQAGEPLDGVRSCAGGGGGHGLSAPSVRRDQRRKAAATPASTGMCMPVVCDRSPPVSANTAAATCSGSTSRLSNVRCA